MFKIGAFARVANVSVYLLRHYADIGLFVPMKIDQQSGYRYYSVEQLPRLHRIIALRELGLTLEQIAKMLDDHISDCEIQGMLLLKQQQVEQIIEQEHTRLRRIESRLAQLQTEHTPQLCDVVIKSAPEVLYLSTGHRTMSDDEASDILRETYYVLKEQDALSMDYALVLVHDGRIEEGLHNIEIGYPVNRHLLGGIKLELGVTFTTRCVEATDTVATVMHHGARQVNGQIYQAIFTWMEANHYTYLESRCSREIYYLAGESDSDPQTIVEIQVPIIKS